MMALHPVLPLSSALFLAAILLATASHKIRTPHRFARQLEDYDLLPLAAITHAGRLLPVAEIVTALLLLVPQLRILGGLCAVALLVLYTAAIAVNLYRGRRDIDCGCGGFGVERALNGALIARNAGLLVVAVLAASPAAPISLHMFGLVLIAFCAATALVLYAAIDGLLANQASLNSLSGR